jgi:effector-binding domain-containing protein
MVFINNYCPEVTPQAGALVCTPRCQIQKIVMPVGSHSKSVWQNPVLKKHGLKCIGLLSPFTRDNPIKDIVHGGMVLTMHDISIVEVSARQVLGMKKTGTYMLIPELLMKIYEFAVGKKIQISGAPIFLCHETTPEAVMEANEKGTAMVEVAWPVSGTVKGTQEMNVYELPGGKMVHTVHQGPYESCETTYHLLFAWIEAQGLRISGPIREVYTNDPRLVKPEEIITMIYVPVR